METLVEKFGYQKYPQKHFESRFTRFYEGFWLPQRFDRSKFNGLKQACRVDKNILHAQ